MSMNTRVQWYMRTRIHPAHTYRMCMTHVTCRFLLHVHYLDVRCIDMYYTHTHTTYTRNTSTHAMFAPASIHVLHLHGWHLGSASASTCAPAFVSSAACDAKSAAAQTRAVCPRVETSRCPSILEGAPPGRSGGAPAPARAGQPPGRGARRPATRGSAPGSLARGAAEKPPGSSGGLRGPPLARNLTPRNAQHPSRDAAGLDRPGQRPAGQSVRRLMATPAPEICIGNGFVPGCFTQTKSDTVIAVALEGETGPVDTTRFDTTWFALFQDPCANIARSLCVARRCHADPTT
jgi:hypothetical protein